MYRFFSEGGRFVLQETHDCLCLLFIRINFDTFLEQTSNNNEIHAHTKKNAHNLHNNTRRGCTIFLIGQSKSLRKGSSIHDFP